MSHYDPKRYERIIFKRRNHKLHLVLSEWPHHFSLSCGLMYGKIKIEKPGQTSTYIVGCEDVEEWMKENEWRICRNCMRSDMYKNETRSAMQHAAMMGYKKSAP
jgi:hypothetical protein